MGANFSRIVPRWLGTVGGRWTKKKS